VEVVVKVECCCSFSHAWTGAPRIHTTSVHLEHHRFHHESVVFARWWIWRSQCLHEIMLEVEDDDVLKVVDVLLIQINRWGDPPI
jgi:hypothetical protein